MKLLINLCAQDGIISHNSGVGTMVKRYIKVIDSFCKKNKIKYKLNLFTPEYYDDSFGYSKETEIENRNNKNITIYKISNGSKGKKFFGNIDNWKKLCLNTSKIINKFSFDNYDYVITILNDTPFGNVMKRVKKSRKHFLVWIPHSTTKIHMYGLKNVFSKSKKERITYEREVINYINNNNNCYVGIIGKFIGKHLIKKYKLNSDKGINVFNGEILSEKTIYVENERCKELFELIKNEKEIVLSFGRPEKYKNLHSVIKLSKYLKIKTVIATQEYFNNMEYVNYLRRLANKNNTLLYINEPFNYPQYIINHFKGKIILIVPSKKEIAGLVVNEIRKFNKKKVLLIANDIDGINEQINEGVDGTLVNLNHIKLSADKIKKCYNEEYMERVRKGAIKRLNKDYDFEKNFTNFLNYFIGE